ncbi:hypothetical protein SteCoe_34351 [Stentor coeruleus]|uniref:Uncharacterized protein n=1 Tax=Stentor coeruleus TaxID=5963 RepID=A0A1R2AUP3_9CILI|nr:hypothetical protein SteCoe_34351 [Stentor coeruleus]
MDPANSFSIGSINSPIMIVINKDYISITENSLIHDKEKHSLIKSQHDRKLKAIHNQIPYIERLKLSNEEQSSEIMDDFIVNPEDNIGNSLVKIEGYKEIPNNGLPKKANYIQKSNPQCLPEQNHVLNFFQVLIHEKSKNPNKSFCQKICSCCINYDIIYWKAFNKLVIAPISYFPQPRITFEDFLYDLNPNYQFFINLHNKINETYSNILQGPSSGLNIYLMYFYNQRFPYHISKINRGECDDLIEKWILSVKNAVELVRDNKKNKTKNGNGIVGVLFRGFVVYFTEISLEGSRVKKTLAEIESKYEKIEYNETLELD